MSHSRRRLVVMAIAQHQASEVNSSRVTFGAPPRPYKDFAASQLADTLEAQYGVEPLNEQIVFELLTRALEAENGLEPPSDIRH